VPGCGNGEELDACSQEKSHRKQGVPWGEEMTLCTELPCWSWCSDCDSATLLQCGREAGHHGRWDILFLFGEKQASSQWLGLAWQEKGLW